MLTPNGGVFGRNPDFNNVTVAGNLTVNGDITLGDDIVVADSLTVQGSTASSSTTTGALVVTGGVGIGGALNTGADAVINTIRVGQGPAGTNNTVVGNGAGSTLTATADYNVLIGRSAGAGITTQDFNVGVGFGTLNANGIGNTAIGDRAARLTGSATGGNYNVAAGYAALYNNVNGSGIVAIGNNSLYNFAPSGASTNVTACGTSALQALTTGLNNTAIGTQASAEVQTASNTTAVGTFALLRNRSADNTAVGTNAAFLGRLGTQVTAVGKDSLTAATTSINAFTTTPVAGGTGYTANQTGVTVTLVKKSGADTFAGTVQASLTTNASGVVTAVAATPISAGTQFTGTGVIFEPSGFGAGSGCEISIASLVSASSNTAVGHGTGALIVSGSQNTCIGAVSLDAVTSGSRNTGAGFDALGAATGSDNTALGADAGDGIVAGDQNTCIGSNADVSASGNSNSIVIGYNAVGDGSNTSVIGNASITSHKLHGTATSAVVVSGDTLRIVTRKAPASNAAGTAGDVCIGEAGGTHYLYYCIANNNWGRVAFTTGY